MPRQVHVGPDGHPYVQDTETGQMRPLNPQESISYHLALQDQQRRAEMGRVNPEKSYLTAGERAKLTLASGPQQQIEGIQNFTGPDGKPKYDVAYNDGQILIRPMGSTEPYGVYNESGITGKDVAEQVANVASGAPGVLGSVATGMAGGGPVSSAIGGGIAQGLARRAMQSIGGRVLGIKGNVYPAAAAQEGIATAAMPLVLEGLRGGSALVGRGLEKIRPAVKRGLATSAGIGDIGQSIQETEILNEAIAKLRGKRKAGSSFLQLARRLIREVDKPTYNMEAAEAAELARASDKTVDLMPVLRKLQAAAKAQHPSTAGREHVEKTLSGFIERVQEGLGIPSGQIQMPGVPGTPATTQRGLGGALMGLPEEVSSPAGRGIAGKRVVIGGGGQDLITGLTPLETGLKKVPMGVAQDIKMFLQEEAAPSSAVVSIPQSASSALNSASAMVRLRMETGMQGVVGPSGRPFRYLNRIASRKNEIRQGIFTKMGEQNEFSQEKRLEAALRNLYQSKSAADRELLTNFESIGKATGAPVSGTVGSGARQAAITEYLSGQKEGLPAQPRVYVRPSGTIPILPFVRIQSSPALMTRAASAAERVGGGLLNQTTRFGRQETKPITSALLALQGSQNGRVIARKLIETPELQQILEQESMRPTPIVQKPTLADLLRQESDLAEPPQPRLP